MAKGRLERHADGSATVLIDCPGCGMLHAPRVEHGTGPEHPLWGWNGNLEAPTFTPSILVKWVHHHRGPQVCHSFVTDGRIQFLGDCTHPHAGETMALLEIES